MGNRSSHAFPRAMSSLSARARAAIIIAAAASTAVGGIAVAGAASASTPGCATGTYASYCGTETDHEPAPLSFDVYKQQTADDTPIIGYPDSSTDPATDFFTFGYQGGSNKIFEYAPNGVASNMCITVKGYGTAGKLVLESCGGWTWQQFTATPAATGYNWANV